MQIYASNIYNQSNKKLKKNINHIAAMTNKAGLMFILPLSIVKKLVREFKKAL